MVRDPIDFLAYGDRTAGSDIRVSPHFTIDLGHFPLQAVATKKCPPPRGAGQGGPPGWVHGGLRRRRARVAVVSSGASHPGERNWTRQRGAATEPYLKGKMPGKTWDPSKSRNLETRAAPTCEARIVTMKDGLPVQEDPLSRAGERAVGRRRRGGYEVGAGGRGEEAASRGWGRIRHKSKMEMRARRE